MSEYVAKDDDLDPWFSGCPQCGSVGKRRWCQEGKEVCEECWLEEGQSPKPVAKPAPPPLMPSAITLRPESELPIIKRRSDRKRHWARRTYASHCLICGHIVWDSKDTKCKRCGGLAIVRSERDLILMERGLQFRYENWMPDTDARACVSGMRREKEPST